MLTLTDDSTGDFQGNHSGHCLYLTLMIRKLSGDTKSYHTHLDQQTVNTLAEFIKRGGSFLQYSCFHTQAYFVSKAQETASDKKCLHRSQLPKYQGIHDMKWISASCCLWSQWRYPFLNKLHSNYWNIVKRSTSFTAMASSYFSRFTRDYAV